MNHSVMERLYSRYPELEAACSDDIKEVFELIKVCYQNGGKLLICGNGGSAADCEHIVGELMKGFLLKRLIPNEFRGELLAIDREHADYIADRLQGALPAISLVSHSALSTAFANDQASDLIFAQQVYGYGKRGDVLLAISTSGHSANVMHAVRVAKAMGVHTVGLTGQSGGDMKGLCDATISVPYEYTPDIQERHLPIYHALCILIEEEFFAS
ncbi:D-sedoheptulose 7-phosphate isomerase [Paenibacillus endophyticus]|uniref:D-sedoheptulose 7-phosphate isomerase n=1 Tax=Paenibacillus endophyticus TaxID=1294268 RepID=A0A7W5G8S8_9BACL|nr:SIS domain-containing protein [Paenibacillus endophyticus]MBB3150593.1 D-sedoheptulose 7-phosphate isomerase [Paenibacillus endophyticus]